MKRCQGLFLAFASLWAACSAQDVAPTGTKAGAAKDRVSVWVVMKKEANLNPAQGMGNWKSRGDFVVNQLRVTADNTQADLTQYLTDHGAEVKPFWIVNAMKVTATGDVIADLQKRPDVKAVMADYTYHIPTPIKGKDEPGINALEWGITNIKANQVWSTFGNRGEGIVVANIDTGAQFDHPALVNQYRGKNADGTFNHNYNWFDPSNTCGNPSTAPCDNNGHGSHTMGTMVGRDAAGQNEIGVAPGARWMAAKGCESSGCSLESLLASGQWMLAPTDLNGQNPRTDLRPHIINNSWGGSGGDTFYQAIVQSWVAAGMFPTFSNGNAGPGCGTVGAPGAYPETFGVGAYDINNAIASFSSRGPSSVPGASIKPNISAPGVNVRSSVPGGSYSSFSGTSMAAPHVSGAIALLWSAAPTLRGDVAATKALLNQTAIRVSDLSCGGTADDNNVWGKGRLDILAAVTAAPRGMTGTLRGTVSAGGNPVRGARVAVTGPISRTTETDANGAYSFVLSVGTYNMAVSAFGYGNASAMAQVTDGGTTTQNFTLVPVPSYALSGVVRDADNQPISGATVTIGGTPLAPATTNAMGQYSFAMVPAGEYQVTAAAGGCNQPRTLTVAIMANKTQDFTLARKTDSYGYYCQRETYSYVDANTVVPLTGDDAVATVTLPFLFEFYGKNYTQAVVSTNGFLSFLAGTQPAFSNTAIPSPAAPNAAIYPYWTDLLLDSSSSVRTEVVGTAPSRKFVIEWRNATFFSSDDRVSFEVILQENGHVIMQYKDHDGTPLKNGNASTEGIEDDAGSVALQYAFNEAVLKNGLAIRYRLPPSGFVQGKVTDGNDNAGIAGAQIQVNQGGRQVRASTTDDQGNYRVRVPVGSVEIVATARSYSTGRATATVAEDQTVTRNFVLNTGKLVVNPSAIEIVTTPDQIRTRTINLRNVGRLALDWQARTGGGGRVAVAPALATVKVKKGADAQAHSTNDITEGGVNAGWGPTEAGRVIRSFQAGSLAIPWGIGQVGSGNLWISDASAKKNHEFRTDGTPTGTSADTPWVGTFGGDMAYDTRHNLMCQVAVGGDNGIHCFDPATGAERDKITGTFPWTAISQRGLAYREDDDSFYIGGWNEGVVYHVKGLGAMDKGAVLGSCNSTDKGISGMAWNPAAEVLWVQTNSATDTIYRINPETCTVLGTIAHPAPGFNGAGLDLDPEGNLWVMKQKAPGTVYLIESGVPAYNDVSWLGLVPRNGTLQPNGQINVALTINTANLAPGAYLARLYFLNTGGRNPSVTIPVSLIVSGYQRGVNAGGGQYLDSSGDTWVADQIYRRGGFGYMYDRGTQVVRQSIAGTPDPSLYQDCRVDPYLYRFDNLPSGTYQVELRLAELTQGIKAGDRLFDVIIKDELVAPAVDIAYRKGVRAADNHVFYTTVTDGYLDVRFVQSFDGTNDPVVNAIRITQRPDR